MPNFLHVHAALHSNLILQYIIVILAPLVSLAPSHFQSSFFFSLSFFLSASLILSYTRITACVHRCQSTRQTNAESKFIFGVAVGRKTNSLPARTGKEVAGRVVYIYPFVGNETKSFEKRWPTDEMRTSCGKCKEKRPVDKNKRERHKRDETKAIPEN